MANMIIVAPAAVAGIVASRGTGTGNLLTASPKEVWADSVAGGAVSFSFDLGTVQPIDTIFLGYIHDAGADASWSITGGAAGYADMELKAAGLLRGPDPANGTGAFGHALWFGSAANVRYIRITVTQAAGMPALMIGNLLVGRAFQPELNREWGAGRRPIDTGSATPLPSGGYGIAEGVRKLGYAWTFGDLSEDEVLALEDIALDRGMTRTLLVVEDPASTAGLARRIHYGLFTQFKAFERRNRAQTRWELSIEQWV